MNDLFTPPLNILVEDVIPLSDVAGEIPGYKVHSTTVWRWHRRGVRGVKLEVVIVGNSICPSRQAVIRFLQRINQKSPTEVKDVS